MRPFPLSLSAACLLAAGAAFAAPNPAAGAVAATVLSSAGGARWILAEPGPLADALEAAAGKDGPRVLRVRGGEGPSLDALASAAAAIPQPRVRAALDLGAAPFLLAWMREDPAAACSNVVLAALPTLPAAAGLAAVPDGAVFRVAPSAPTNASDLARLAVKAEMFRDDLGDLLAGPGRDAPAAAALRRLAAQLADHLGCLLERGGLREEAIEAFRAADAAAPDAPSALLNLASLARDEGANLPRQEIAKRLDALAKSGAQSWTLALDGGPVLRPADFFPAGWFWTVSGVPAADTNALREAFAAMPSDEVRTGVAQALRPAFALQEGNAAMPLAILARLGPEGWDATNALLAADLLFRSAERARALRLVEKARAMPGATAPEELDSIALDYRARMGDAAALREARRTRDLLATPPTRARRDRDLAAAGAETDDFALAAESYARLAEEGGRANAAAGPGAAPPFPEAAWAKTAARGAAALRAGDAATAKAAFAAALAGGATNAWPVLRLALVADFYSGDRDAAAPHAEALLALRPYDHFANFVLANLAAAEKNYAKAQVHFQLSLSEKATWLALNDYASLLSAVGNPALAEKMARDAIQASGGGVPAVHDTLGEALFAQRRFAEAADAFRTAVAGSGAEVDPRFRLHLAEALAALGDKAGAKAQIAALGVAPQLDEDERARLDAVRAAAAE